MAKKKKRFTKAEVAQMLDLLRAEYPEAGCLYGIISSDHDIETIFIDSILKHADVSMGDLPEFIERLKVISEVYGPDFVVSISAEKEEMIGVDFDGIEILN